MYNKALLCGASAILALSSASASAQSHPKPAPSTRTFCESTPTPSTGGSQFAWRDAGPASPWREPVYSEVGPPFPYNETSNPASCGSAVRAKPVQCVDTASGVAASNDKCTSSADSAYAAANPGWTIRKDFSGFPAKAYAIQEADLGQCSGDEGGTYRWKQAEPSTAGVCGTAQVEVAVTCVNMSNDGVQVEDYRCDAGSKPPTTVSVTSTEGCGYEWSAQPWQEPAPSCGQATRTRAVTCTGPDGQPATEQSCIDYFTLPEGDVNKIPTWSQGLYPFPIGSPSPSGNNVIIYRMPTQCQADGGEEIAKICDFVFVDGYRGYLRPKRSQTFDDARSCESDPSDETSQYAWNVPTYAADTPRCGPNTKTARVFCTSKSDGAEVDETLCEQSTKPPSSIDFEDSSGCVAENPQQSSCFGFFGAYPIDPSYVLTEGDIQPPGKACSSNGDGSSTTTYTYAGGTYNDSDVFRCISKGKGSNPMGFGVSGGARMEVYDGPNLTGNKVLDISGPKLVWGGGGNWSTQQWGDLGPMMNQFPPSTRDTTNITQRTATGSDSFPGKGSFRITCPVK